MRVYFTLMRRELSAYFASMTGYVVIAATAFLVGMWTAGRRGLRYGVNPNYIQDAAIWLLVGGIVGARILHVATYWEDFRGKGLLELFKIQNGGLVF